MHFPANRIYDFGVPYALSDVFDIIIKMICTEYNSALKVYSLKSNTFEYLHYNSG